MNIENNVKKDIETAKKAATAAGETAEVFVEAVVERTVKVLNGEKNSLKVTREDVISLIDTMVEKADVYYNTIVDRVMERIEKIEQDAE